MIRIIRVEDDGTETASIEVDDFTIEVIYSGLAEMLREAAATQRPAATALGELPRAARQRRERVLSRIRD